MVEKLASWQPDADKLAEETAVAIHEFARRHNLKVADVLPDIIRLMSIAFECGAASALSALSEIPLFPDCDDDHRH